MDERDSCTLTLVGVGRGVVCVKVIDSATELWTTVLSSTERVSASTLVLLGVGREVVSAKVVDSTTELWTTVLSIAETVADV